MVCNNTFIRARSPQRTRAAFTVLELLIAAATGVILAVAVMTLLLFTLRSVAAVSNYVDLDMHSRNTLDMMTQEIRQADKMVSGDSHRMVFQFTNPTNTGVVYNVTYAYSPDARTLVRLQGTSRTVLLTNCNFLDFSFFQRNPVGGTYDQYPMATPGTCKLVQLRWICSRDIMQQAVNTESVQSAKVVIRKE